MRDFTRSMLSLRAAMGCFLAAALVLCLMILGGCSNSSTHGTEKDLDVKVTINNTGNGNVSITSPLTLDSASETAQDTANKATTSPTTRLQLTEGGSTAAGEASTLKDVASTLRQKMQSDNPTTTTNTNSNNPSTTNSTTAPTAKPADPAIDSDKESAVDDQVDTGKEEASEDLDYKNKATFTSYGVRNGGRQAWRISGKGPSFGDRIKFVFASGKTFTVNNTSKNCRDREDTCERDKSAEMYGFVFKPGLGPNGDGDSDTGTSHSGIYLHAPYGDSSKTVTLYYNKP